MYDLLINSRCTMHHLQDRCLRDLSDCIGGMERKIKERMDAYERSASSLIEKAFREVPIILRHAFCHVSCILIATNLFSCSFL